MTKSLVVVLLLSAAGCSGGRSTAPELPRDAASTPVSTPAARLVPSGAIVAIAVAVTVPPAGASRRRRPQSVPLVASVTLTAFPASAPQVTASGPCAGGICNISIGVPSGSETFMAQLYDGSGNLMFAGRAATTIVPDQNNVVAIVPGHVVASMTSTFAAAVPAGIAGTATLSIAATDAAGGAITSGTIADANGNAGSVALGATTVTPVVSGGNAAGSVSFASSIVDAAQLASIPVAYDGRALISATVTATAPGTGAPPTASAVLAVTPTVYEFAGAPVARDGKAGPDGNVWLAQWDNSTNQFQVIVPPPPGATTLSSTVYPLAPYPGGFGLAFTSDNQIWTTTWGGTLVRCPYPPALPGSFASTCTSFNARVKDHTDKIAAGSDGAVYEVQSYFDATRMPVTAPATIQTPIPGTGGGGFINQGADGRLWTVGGQYTCCGHPKITAITPGTTPVVATYPAPGSSNVDTVMPGLDGNIWSVSRTTDAVSRMATDGSGVTSIGLPTPGVSPYPMAPAADAMYVGYANKAAVVRVPYSALLTSDMTELTTSAGVSSVLLTGPDGNVYGTLSNNKLVKIAI